MRIGIDSGGTFTDFVIARGDGSIEVFKLRSNRSNPAAVILEGLKRIGRRRSEVVHGSTVATNALLERKGARTALVTTRGFEDVIQIGRQNRPELYNLTPAPKRALIPPENCFGIDERTFFDGQIESAPNVRGLLAKLEKFESVAICFLHSYRNPANELAVKEALADLPYVCASHEICPEFREYERTSTTVLNAYVGPLMDRYLGELERARVPRLLIMQSNGGVISAGEARRQAVRTLLSGPAGGVVGAIAAAKVSGFTNILGFDMGGTSTDVCISQGAPHETAEAMVDGFPVRVPMLDIQTVGAGGGSIARVDEGGLLRVGPESAGADPGPACYGVGTLPTVTDAHVVLGRIDGELLDGAMPIDLARAESAVDVIAKCLGVTRTAAALGILRVANANMERAIRSVSVERGYDPREFALLAFGGCGGLHACEIAADMGIPAVIVPQHAGVLSALGMLLADKVRDYASGVMGRSDIEGEFKRLEKMARRDLRRARLLRFADVRYQGQSYELTIPFGGSFHDAHHRAYGYSDPNRATEMVTIRVRAVEEVLKPPLGDARLKKSERRKRSGSIPAYTRDQVSRPILGPALIKDYGATSYVAEGWAARRDRAGNIVMKRSS